MATKLNRNQLGGYVNTRNSCNIFTFESTSLKKSDIELLGFLDTAYDVFNVGDILKIFIKSNDGILLSILEYVIIKKDPAYNKLYKHKIGEYKFSDLSKDNKTEEQ